MIARSLFALLLLLGASAPGHAVAQQRPPRAEPGIWIEDHAGRLRRVEPAASFLRPPPAPAPEGALRVVLAVESFAQSASGALSAGEMAVTRVVSALSRLGLASGEVHTAPPRVEPRYEPRGVLAREWEGPRLAGFHAAHLVTLRTRHPERLGLLIDLAVGAGATRVLAVETDPAGP